MVRLRYTWFAGAVVALVSAGLGCHGDRPLTSQPGRAVADISDGVHDAPGFQSNPHFFFLPPMVDAPSATGVFNPRLAPSVQICSQTVTPCPSNQVHALFTVLANRTDLQYSVNWNTDPTTEPVGASYRIAVLVREQTLGFADILMVAPGAVENASTGAVILLQDGRTLPITLRIEDGALCPPGATLDCAEQVATPALDNTIVTANGLAGAFIPAGALSQPVTVSIVQDTATPCLPAPFALPQYLGCYQFFTDPGPSTFSTPVTVGMCVEVGLPMTAGTELQIFRFDPGLPVQPLQEASAGFLPCDATEPYRELLGRRRSVTDRMLAFVGRLLGPRLLLAAHDGVGGMTDSFSTFSWVLPAAMVPQIAPPFTGVVGTAVSAAPTVLLVDTTAGRLPVAGVKVTFTVLGGGSIANSTVVTGSNGLASVGSWVLGATSSVNQVIATAVGAIGSPDTFTVVGVSPVIFP